MFNVCIDVTVHLLICYFILFIFTLFIYLFIVFYFTVYFSIVLFSIAMQPGTRISFGINEVISYLILSYLISS